MASTDHPLIPAILAVKDMARVEEVVELARRAFELGLHRPDPAWGADSTPLIWAALGGRDDLVQALLPFSDPLSAEAHLGRTALHVACEKGRVSCVRILAAAVGPGGLDARDHEQLTALMACSFAAGPEAAACAEILVGAGASLDARCRLGRSALGSARAQGRNPQLVAFLEAAELARAERAALSASCAGTSSAKTAPPRL